MANKLQIKRTSVSGRTPNTTNSGNGAYIDAGELAFNLTDEKLFTSNGSVSFEVGSNLSSISVSGTATLNAVSANGTVGSNGQVLTSNGSTAYWANSTGSSSSSGAATLYSYYDNFTGNGSNTVFTLPRTTTTNSVYVAINGVVQQPTTVYSVSNNTLTFTSAIDSGDNIDVRYNAISSANGTLSEFKEFIYTASNNQTTFTGSDSNSITLQYDPGYLTVHVNGVKLAPADYTATTGNTVVLQLAASNNDIVQVQSYARFYLTEANITLSKGSIDSNTYTTSALTQVVCDSFSTTLYRTAKYLIQVVDNTNSDYYSTEALVIHTGTSAYISVYGEVYSNVALATLDTSINSGVVQLLVTPTTANSTIKTIRTAITV